MNTGLLRIEWSRFAGLGDRCREWLDQATLGYRSHPGLGRVGLATAVVAAIGLGLGGWMLLSGLDGDAAENGRARMAIATPEPVAPADEAIQAGYPSPTAAEPASIDGLKISSQRWRRAGLGSKALVSFTLRNANFYPVKDIEISCAFSRSDGRHLTDRRRVIHDTVKTRGRKTFSGIHVGFVNINAYRATCAPVAASRI